MTSIATPREVFLALISGVAAQRWSELPALYAVDARVRHPFATDASALLVGREQLKEHFAQAGRVGMMVQADDVVVHETGDPEDPLRRHVFCTRKIVPPSRAAERQRWAAWISSYSYSLLISLISGCAGVLIGVLTMVRRGSRSRLIRLGLPAVVLAALSLVISIVHWRWGHGPPSAEPMGIVRFAGSHTGFLAASVVIVVGLVLVLYARRRGLAA